jgi:hypothetical protein
MMMVADVAAAVIRPMAAAAGAGRPAQQSSGADGEKNALHDEISWKKIVH